MDDDVLTRAVNAYLKTDGAQQPGQESDVRTVGGEQYAVLRNMHGVLAVYKVGADGAVRRQADYPEGLN